MSNQLVIKTGLVRPSCNRISEEISSYLKYANLSYWRNRKISVAGPVLATYRAHRHCQRSQLKSPYAALVYVALDNSLVRLVLFHGDVCLSSSSVYSALQRTSKKKAASKQPWVLGFNSGSPVSTSI